MERAVLELAQMARDPSVQQRVAPLKPGVIRQYAEAIGNGATLPPLVVFWDGARYILADGHYRYEAALQGGIKDFAVEIHKGGLREARLYATGANTTHGCRLTNRDKRKAVLTLLCDPEWSQWGDRKIARHTGTTHPFVLKLRKQLKSWNQNKDQATAAEDSAQQRHRTEERRQAQKRLRNEVTQLREQVTLLEVQNKALREEVARLEAELEEAEAGIDHGPAPAGEWLDFEEAHTIYRTFMWKYHPDRNPTAAGLAQGVNAFWDALKEAVQPSTS